MKPTKINGKIALLSLVITSLVSCSKFGDMNINPTRSSNLNPTLQLAQIQLKYSGDLEDNERLDVLLTMPMIQQIAGSWSNQWGGMYVKQQQYLSLLWEKDYPDKIVNIVDAVERTNGIADKSNINAICRIMKVYLFARLTDLYGDIPYSEAGIAYTKGVVRPKYDKQEDIYTSFFKELTEASLQLNASKDANTDELFYKGDADKWRKFANSLRLRLAMRLVKRDPVKAKAEAMAAFNAGVFTSNDDICMLRHQDIQNDYTDLRGNGVSAALNSGEIISYRVCNTFINTLKATNDPRLDYMVRCYVDKSYKPFERVDITDQVKSQVGLFGVNSGDFVWDDWKNTITVNAPSLGNIAVDNNTQKAQVANFLIANDAPYFHLTYAEVELLLADACFRWSLNMGGDAATHFQKGLEAACNQLSLFPGGPLIDAAKIAKFKSDNPLIPGKELEIINTQLWVALFLNGPEAYANWRRTGFPKLTPGYKAGYSTLNTIPRKFEYPLSEKEQNVKNYQEAVQQLGGTDDWSKRVWWDKE